METAMNIFFEELKMFMPSVYKKLDNSIKQNFLEKEKAQIIETCNDMMETGSKWDYSAEQYYNDKYK